MNGIQNILNQFWILNDFQFNLCFHSLYHILKLKKLIIKNKRMELASIIMKLLMIYAEQFAYRTGKRTLDSVEECQEEKQIKNALIGFIQVEKEDEEKMEKVETKLIKNLKWAAKKNHTDQIVLHSFAHLSLSKGDPEITVKIFDHAEKRLEDAHYQTFQTPFGYFLDLDLKAPGKSLARVFKEF